MTDSVRSTRLRPVKLLLWLAVTSVVLAATPAAPPRTGVASAQSPSLPDRLSNAAFWSLASGISEPGGYFQNMDNFTSNEREIGPIVGVIRRSGPSGGVYLGVGPEQNLTYISAIRPAMAFIVDIRRQAVMQHLMFKAIFELSDDRADFLSLLFSKPRPAGINRATPIEQIWTAYWPVASDPDVSTKNYERIASRLTRTHGFTLTTEESAQLRNVFDAFFRYGPQISTRGVAGGVTFAALTGGTFDEAGEIQSFLASDEAFRFVKGLHERNLIVPVSGDFSGPKAIRAIGAYLRERRGVVSAFYVSNVEEYLFREGKAHAFYSNVATLPVGEASVFIRPYSLRRGGQALCPIGSFLRAAEAGRVLSNNDALVCVQ